MTFFGLSWEIIAALWNSANWAMRWVCRVVIGYPIVVIVLAMLGHYDAIEKLTIALPVVLFLLFLGPHIRFRRLRLRGRRIPRQWAWIVYTLCVIGVFFFPITSIIVATATWIAMNGVNFRPIDPLIPFILHEFESSRRILGVLAGLFAIDITLGLTIQHFHFENDPKLAATFVLAVITLLFFVYASTSLEWRGWSTMVTVTSIAIIFILIVAALGGRAKAAENLSELTIGKAGSMGPIARTDLQRNLATPMPGLPSPQLSVVTRRKVEQWTIDAFTLQPGETKLVRKGGGGKNFEEIRTIGWQDQTPGQCDDPVAYRYLLSDDTYTAWLTPCEEDRSLVRRLKDNPLLVRGLELKQVGENPNLYIVIAGT